MRQIQFEKTGSPSEVLTIKEVPIPEPGPGDIRIKVTAANINPSDIMFVRGLYGIKPNLPAVPGFEGVGIVDKCGENSNLKIGDKVVFTTLGSWADFVIVDENRAFPAPKSLSDEIACQALINPLTAFAMLDESGIRKGQWLLLTAGGSALGQFAVQLCKERGIKTICTVRRDDQVEMLLKLGATAVINIEKESLYRRSLILTEKQGVDFVFEAVGGDFGAKSIACMGDGGTMFVYGALSEVPIPVNSGLLIFKDITIKGFWLTSWLVRIGKEERERIADEILQLLYKSDLKVNIQASYSMAEITEAVKHAESPGRTGKIILNLAKQA